MKTYGFLTPEFCTETKYMKTPFLEFTDLLAKPTKGLLIKAPTETVEA
jgi:small subunit ribosomal protein S2e